jgi:hypothetical protein
MFRIPIILLLACLLPGILFSQLEVNDSSLEKRIRTNQVRTISISKISLAADADISVKGNNVMIFDRQNNRAVLLSIAPGGDTVQEYWDLKGHLFPYKQVLRKTRFDSLLYEELRPALLQNGDAAATILGITTDDSSGYLLFNFPLPKIIKDNYYIPEPNYFIYSRNFFSGKKDLQAVDLKSLNLKNKSEYQVATKQTFIFRIPLKDTSRQKPSVNLLSSWTKKPSVGFTCDTAFLAYTPSELKELGHDSVRIRSNQNFLFNDNARLVYHYEKAKQITVKTLMLFHVGKLLDVKEKDGRLLLLVLKKNKVDVVIYDRQLEQVFGQVPILIPENCQLSSARFCDNNNLAILSADKKLLHILKIE